MDHEQFKSALLNDKERDDGLKISIDFLRANNVSSFRTIMKEVYDIKPAVVINLLEFAAKKNVIQVCEILLEGGVDPNCRHTYMRHSLFNQAIEFININLVKVLLRYGANPNLFDGATTSLLIAIDRNSVQLVEILLNEKVDPNMRSKYGNIPLIEAVKGGNGIIVSMLLKAGADTNASSDNDGDQTAIFFLKDGRTSIATLLIEAGANLGHLCKKGNTAIHKYTRNGVYSLVEFLLNSNISPDIRNSKMRSLLFVDSKEKYLIAKMLVERGADVNTLDYKGRSLLDHFKYYKDYEMIEYLLNTNKINNVLIATVIKGDRVKKRKVTYSEGSRVNPLLVDGFPYSSNASWR